MTLDDGSGQTKRHFIIDGSMGRIEVAAEQYDGMTWVTKLYGARAIIEPSDTLRRQLAVAIKTLSPDVRCRTVYTHTGWRKIDREWHSLHAGGSIPSNEALCALLGPPLSEFRLPAPSADPAHGRASIAGACYRLRRSA